MERYKNQKLLDYWSFQTLVVCSVSLNLPISINRIKNKIFRCQESIHWITIFKGTDYSSINYPAPLSAPFNYASPKIEDSALVLLKWMQLATIPDGIIRIPKESSSVSVLGKAGEMEAHSESILLDRHIGTKADCAARAQCLLSLGDEGLWR